MTSAAKNQRTNILAKISMVWDLNPNESLASLITALSGRTGEPYIAHEYRGGNTYDIEARMTPVNIIGLTDYELEKALDDHL